MDIVLPSNVTIITRHLSHLMIWQEQEHTRYRLTNEHGVGL
jgi:hypothetical protein